MLCSQSAPKARRGRGWGLGRDSPVEIHKGKSVGIERTKGGILGKRGAAKELEMEQPEGQEDSREIEEDLKKGSQNQILQRSYGGRRLRIWKAVMTLWRTVSDRLEAQ